MQFDDALLTIAHQANEHRVLTMRLQQMVEQAQRFAAERDQALRERDEALAKLREAECAETPA